MIVLSPLSELPAPSEQACPHLGLEEDDETCLAYPSPWNLCHHCKPAAAVLLSHQKIMCLRHAYQDCPVFRRVEQAPLPGELRWVDAGPGLKV